MSLPGVLKLQLGLLELDLNDIDATGFAIQSIDIPSPSVRAVTNDLPQQDGADDQTQNFSAGTVQLTGAIVPDRFGNSRTRAKDTLAPFIAPGARPTLVFQLDSDVGERCLDMRVSQWSNLIDHPRNASGFSVAWVTPYPIAYEQEINEIDVPITMGSSGGRTYTRSYPRTYVSTPPSSLAVPVWTGGTYVAWPTLNIYGPCTDPAVYWLDPDTDAQLGIQVVFKGLTVDALTFLQVDTRARTVYLNGDAGASRYSFLDFAKTEWGPLQPGANLIQFNPASATVPSVAEVMWRDSFLV